MNHRRIAPAIGALALMSAMLATGSAAQAAVPNTPVHGCPAGDVCLYNAESQYDNNNPPVTVDIDGDHFFPVEIYVLIAVNNTAAFYASEGYFEGTYNPKPPHNLLFCFYHPYTEDIEAPGATVNGNDEIAFTIETGATLASVDAIKLVSNSYCPPSD